MCLADHDFPIYHSAHPITPSSANARWFRQTNELPPSLTPYGNRAAGARNATPVIPKKRYAIAQD